MAKIKVYAIVPFLLQKAVLVIIKPIFFYFTRLEVVGLENLQNAPKNVIFASNHTSELDPILVPVAIPLLSRFSPMFYISREKSFYDRSGWRQIFYGGLFFKAFGAYPVSVGLKDYELSLKNHIEILNDNLSVLIFPEGIRTDDGRIKSARGGVIYLSVRTGLPIVPIGISNLYKMTAKDFFFRKRKLTITFGKPIFYKHNQSADDIFYYKEKANEVMEEIKRLVGVGENIF